jgi:hypothetical protein
MSKISQVQECSLLEAAFAFLCKFLIAAWSLLFLSVLLVAIASVLAISLRKRIYSISLCYSHIYMAEEAYSRISVQEWLCYECCFVQTLKKISCLSHIKCQPLDITGVFVASSTGVTSTSDTCVCKNMWIPIRVPSMKAKSLTPSLERF